MRFMPILPATMALAACQTAGPAVDGPVVGTGDTCGAAAYSDDIGRPVATLEVPQDRMVRRIGPNDAVTMDYLEGRLNLVSDDEGRLVRAWCG
ncbi:peptidase inhibitor I78 family protein [Palleronia sediminis]|uniref:Peptidase inhibitor I78 family protein n=1 Tax=Palleronia sediminis TaxID=2547833 RepID=A0A4R6A6Q7_9RHOB|nr:I78 family peptidase inhibitor [Palleronia sediminis]TDL78407.1 peptidase inhibitor I78 family protein [Palleronia sediminis]